MTTVPRFWSLLAATTILLAACGKDTPAPNPAPPAPKPLGPHGFVRMINALALDPKTYHLLDDSIELQADTLTVKKRVGAGQASAYYPVAIGRQLLLGNLKPESGYELLTGNLVVEENKRYSLVAFSSGRNKQLNLVREEPLPAAVVGKAQLRIINFASSYAPVRIEEVGGAVFQAALDWGKTREYAPVEARAYNLVTVNTYRTDQVQFTQHLELQPGKAYSLILRGDFQPDYPSEQAAYVLVEDK